MTEDAASRSIQPLDDGTIQRIAAGEVVERPASVVKELLENSLDAGATRISVAVEAGGIDGIRVRDNGHGIPRDELPMAVAEHATSKLRDIADLDRGVSSLGFRGEALSTIGAVSRLTLRSRAADATAGAELTVEGGDVSEVQLAGCPQGTTVEVADLFFNTPARKKFLKREATEFDHVNTVVSQYALANPDVAIALEHDGRERFATEGSGSLRSAVLSVYGREVAESMIDVTDGVADAVDADSGGDAVDEHAPVESVSGLVSHPETTRSTREYLATFVNGRYVTAGSLRGAVIDAYGGQLAPDRYPFVVLFVDVPPDSVDVNVHPRKTEVRFDDESTVVRTVRERVERALIEGGLIRSAAPRGRSAPAETPVSPTSVDHDSEVVGGAGTDHEAASGADSDRSGRNPSPTADLDSAEDRADDWLVDGSAGDDPETARNDRQAAQREHATPNESASPVDPAADDSWRVDGLGTERPVAERDTEASTTESSTASSSTVSSSSAGSPAESRSFSSESSPSTESHPSSESTPPESIQRSWPRPDPTAEPTQQTLSGGETAAGRTYDQLPSLRVLGQLYDTYLLAEAGSGLLLIDQHAADERINYERLKRTRASSPTTQTLAESVSIELTAREAALFEAAADVLAELGFRTEHDSAADDDTADSVAETDDADSSADPAAADRSLVVTAVPAVFDTALDPALLREALVDFFDGGGTPRTVEEAADDLLADLACYPSVTGNTSLTEGSVIELLSALDGCENPYACPHGRPVIIEISREEIADRFERDYPGHAGRRAE